MDLNTLISTIVSSTAALVAIIGGFLVSRVIAISGEQNGVTRRIREINNDLYAKQELIRNIEEFLLEDDVSDFFKDNIQEILKGDLLFELIEEDKYNDRTEEELEPYFKEFKDIIREIEYFFIRADTLPEDFFEFYKEKKHIIQHPHKKDWYEIAYDGLIEYNSEPTNYSPFNPLSVKTPNIPLPNLDYRDSRKERDRLIDDIKILKLHKKEQQKILGDYGKPQWIWGGLFVLIYACVVGIIYPISILPYPDNTYNDSLTKFVLLTLFFSQLGALFIYLGIAMYKITHPIKEYR